MSKNREQERHTCKDLFRCKWYQWSKERMKMICTYPKDYCLYNPPDEEVSDE